MNIRNILLPAGLAVLMAGCVTDPGYPYRDYPNDDAYYDYRSTPSYEGYYYARVIFIRNIPYYVDDDRHIRPIPPRLYDHFRKYRYDTLGLPPVFSPDREMREGYPVSHIIYLDGTPYMVGNDRHAHALPERLQPHFRYAPDQGNPPPFGNFPQHPDQHDNDRNNMPPVFGQDRGQFPGSDQHRDERGQHDGGMGAPDSQGRTPPDNRGLPSHQVQPDSGGSHTGTANDASHDRHPAPATVDTAKKNVDKNVADKKKSRSHKKEKPDDNTRPDDGSDKKQRHGKDDNQGGDDRGNGNPRN